MHVSYWLMPADADAAALQKTIDELAGRFDAPRFRPHVTLYSGDASEMDAESIVDAAGRAFKAQTLGAGPLGQTGLISKTLFLSIENAPALAALAGQIRAASKSNGYRFQPHLSLLYKALTPDLREALAQKTKTPLDEIRFDRLEAVHTGGRSLEKTDVEKWKTLADAPLTGFGSKDFPFSKPSR